MTAKEWLRAYDIKKCRYQLLTSERERIDNAIIIKTTYYGDDQEGGASRGIEEKYFSLIEKKKEIDFELDCLKIDIKKIEDALEMIRKNHAIECDMMLMRYLNGKSNLFIQKEMNYSINSITTKINIAEQELEMLLNSQIVISL